MCQRISNGIKKANLAIWLWRFFSRMWVWVWHGVV